MTGGYRMEDGTQKIDVCAKYMLILPDSQIDELIELVLTFKRKTTQEAIYLEMLHGLDVRFI